LYAPGVRDASSLSFFSIAGERRAFGEESGREVGNGCVSNARGREKGREVLSAASKMDPAPPLGRAGSTFYARFRSETVA